MPLRQAAQSVWQRQTSVIRTAIPPRVLPGPYSGGPDNRGRPHALGGATLLRRRPRSGLRRTACELVQQQAANAAHRASRPGVRPARTEKTRRAHLRQPGGAIRRRAYDHPVGLGNETLTAVASCARSVIGKLQNRGRLVRAGRFTRKRHVPTPMYVVGARPSGRVRERRQPKCMPRRAGEPPGHPARGHRHALEVRPSRVGLLRQVSWLAGRHRCLAFPTLNVSDPIRQRLSAHSCGGSSGLERVLTGFPGTRLVPGATVVH